MKWLKHGYDIVTRRLLSYYGLNFLAYFLLFSTDMTQEIVRKFVFIYLVKPEKKS